MPDTRRNIRNFGDGDHWYSPWYGFSPDFIDPWFCAEGTGPGEGGISGPHRDTPEEAVADVEQYKAERVAEGLPPRDSWRIVRFEPALRINIEREILDD